MSDHSIGGWWKWNFGNIVDFKWYLIKKFDFYSVVFKNSKVEYNTIS